mgnify:CR=1 FL=1
MTRFATAALLAMTLAGAATAQTVETKQYDDGGVYEGAFLNGKQHGTGTYTLPNGYSYTGNWVAGEISGTGSATFPNGSIPGSMASKKASAASPIPTVPSMKAR